MIVLQPNGRADTVAVDGAPNGYRTGQIRFAQDGTAYLVTRTGTGTAADPYVLHTSTISLADPPASNM